MRPTLLVLAFCSTLALAQAKTTDFHASALATLNAERSRAKEPLCPKAANTYEINVCDDKEVHLTDANYTRFVRALGVLLRGDNGAKAKDAKPIPFDTAESAWHAYRDKVCTAVGSQYEGGSIRPSIELQCTLTITRHHMEELWELYSTAGTQ